MANSKSHTASIIITIVAWVALAAFLWFMVLVFTTDNVDQSESTGTTESQIEDEVSSPLIDESTTETIDDTTYPKNNSTCDIKGNISYNSGEKIYHMPGQEFYSQTNISTNYGERWFCSEAEARDAGWRRAYN